MSTPPLHAACVRPDAAPQPMVVTLPHWWATYAHARYCVEQRETATAERLLRQLCADVPERAEPFSLLAHVLRASGQMVEAANLAQYALSLPLPNDGTQQLEPDAWRIQPLEDLAISSWHRNEHEIGLWAAERIIHHRAANSTQRDRALRLSAWVYAHLPVAWRRRQRVAPEVFGPHESASTPTIVRSDDGYLLANRLITYDIYPDGQFSHRLPRVVNNTAIALLDADAQPLQWFRLDDRLLQERSHADPATIGVGSIEDPRIFRWQDAWWFVACCWHFRPLTGAGQVLGRLAIDADGARIDHIVPLSYANRQPSEKNWMPVVHNGELLLIYHAEPFTILRPDPDSGMCEVVRQTTMPLSLATYRGSAAPIAWNDGYLYVVHSACHRQGLFVYQQRFVELDSDLAVRRISLPFSLRQRGVEYVLGLTPAHDGEHLLLSHSWMDAENWISAIRRDVVEDLLLPLSDFMIPEPDAPTPTPTAGVAPVAAADDDDDDNADAVLLPLPEWWQSYRAALQHALNLDVATAIQELNDLAAAWPTRPEFPYHLARLARQQGDQVTAYTHATQALALGLGVDLPADGSAALEPDVWGAGPLHEAGISAWYAQAYDIGRNAADLLIHDRRLSPQQRRAGVEHASWYLNPLPLRATRPLAAPDGMLTNHEALANGSLAPLPDGSGYLLAQGVVNDASDALHTARPRDRGEQRRFRTLLAMLDTTGTPLTWQALDASLLDALSTTDADVHHRLGLEHLRLLRWQDAWWFVAATGQLTHTDAQDMVLGRLTLDANGAQVEHLLPLTLEPRQTIEQPWLPFVDAQGELRLLAQSDPLTILSVDVTSGVCTRTIEITPPVAQEHYRGSAGPLRWGPGYVYITHEVATFHDHVVYQHRFVEVDLDWRVQRISLPVTLRKRGIEFALGLCLSLDGRSLLLHHSRMDEMAWISALPLEVLDRLLLPVADLLNA